MADFYDSLYVRIDINEYDENQNEGNGITGHDETSENLVSSWMIAGYERIISFQDILNGDRLDIVIDDGQHTLESQLECIDLYLPKLNKGGVLIIEDVQDASHFEKFIEASEKVSEDDNDDVEYEVECLDFRTSEFHENKGWSPPDDMLFVVRKS